MNDITKIRFTWAIPMSGTPHIRAVYQDGAYPISCLEELIPVNLEIVKTYHRSS